MKGTLVMTDSNEAEISVQGTESSCDPAEGASQNMETLTAIREGLAAAERGELIPAEQVRAEIEAKYGLQG